MNTNIAKLFDRRVGFMAVVAIMIIALIVPAIAAAAQLTDRSIGLSSSSISATNVTYSVNFTATADAGAFVVDFCKNTPLDGEACVAPVGFSATAAASTTAGFTSVSALDPNTIRVTGSIEQTSPDVTVDITGITNPSEAGPMYARIVTYDTATNANLYESEALGSGVIDKGGAAISITNTIGVSGSVLESMSFCVSGEDIGANCADLTAPVLSLGETTGDVTALSADAVSTGSIYAQISTNAANGAVISLKSSTKSCGGLVRAGAPASCDITPALDGEGITAGQAKFGLRTAAAATDAVGAGVGTTNGTLKTVTGSIYNSSTFALNYIAGDAQGVTSIFGDPLLDTDNAPVTNKNMQITFGVSVANNTPAGTYSADLNLVATGKF